MNKLLLPVLLTVLLFSCKKNHDSTTSYDILYVQTNNFNANQNAVLAYKFNTTTNKLEQISGSPFFTGGTGLGNPDQILGPADSDDEIARSADGKFLLTVNSGSNSIAVFTINGDGSLQAVSGSPFPSGGETPVSIAISGNTVFVVNKSQNPLAATTSLPNYKTFTIDNNGALTSAGAAFSTTANTSPAQALVSTNKKFLFGVDFLGFMTTPAVGTLRSFNIGTNGTLTAVSGSPYILPNGATPPDNGALGLRQHPSGNALYVGFPVQGKVGVYAVDQSTGALTFQTTVAAGKAACWLRINNAGNHLYALNSADNTVQLFNTANPLSPVSVQVLQLKNSGPSYPNGAGALFTTSQDFSFNFSTDQKVLYVVSQHTNKDFSIGNYNYLHALIVADDGTITEPGDALQLPVANTIRPKGTLVISRQ